MGRLAGLMLLAVIAGSPASIRTQTPADDDVTVLIAIERSWVKAVMSHDAAPLEGWLADDFVQTSETGEVRTRAETIAHVRDSPAVFTSGGLDDIRVRLYGDAAVVTGRFVAEGHSGGDPFSVRVRWTDTFVRRGGRWLCVASQSTTIG
jgi:ketosteroid isomerase-like protein